MNIRRNQERGSALLVAVVITLMVVAISGAFISHAMVRQRNSVNLMFGSQAVTAAEAGAALYVQDLNKNYWASRSTPLPAVIPPAPPGYRHGFLGSSQTVAAANPDRDTHTVNQSFYRIWSEPMGANGIDDNGVDGVDDAAESTFVRLWIEGNAGGVADLSNAAAPKYRGGSRRTIEVVLTHKDSKVFDFAFFAGNTSGDPYTMVFKSDQKPPLETKDVINGDIYSGGHLDVGGASELRNDAGTGPSGRVMYKDTVKDTSSYDNPTYIQGVQPTPDIAGGNYEARAASERFDLVSNPTGKFVNVAEDLKAYGQTGGNKNNNGMTKLDGSQHAMGKADLQITDTNQPAHIFRLEPSTDNGTNQKRVEGYSGMKPKKANYFLEDPSKTSNNGGTALAPWGQNQNEGSNTGLRVEVKPNGNDKVYYIDGNLWASNGPAFTFQWLNSTSSDMKITIVVKGNVYLTDNLMYDQAAKLTGRKDALAIIAIKDSELVNMSAADLINEKSPFYNQGGMAAKTEQERIDYARDYNKINGSGNIFFGDPGGGTTERFESFMYAENNFYDNNLGGGAGTLETNIYGNMTAGNQIQINRNHSQGEWKPLKVQFDNRLKTGQVTLPGLPESPGAINESWKVVSWRQVASRPRDWGSPGAGMQFNPQ